jgi:hypothetical protein
MSPSGTKRSFFNFAHNVCFALVSGPFCSLRTTAYSVCFRPTPDIFDSVVASSQTTTRCAINWDAVGAIGEIIGGLAVVVTLAIL